MEVLVLNDGDWKPFSCQKASYLSSLCIFKLNVNSYYDRISTHYGNVLSSIEYEKASRFLQEKDRKRYIVSRHGLRHILSLFTSVSPNLIQLHQSENKKPFTAGVEFNSTHSENLVLIAVSPLAVGIDIEFLNPNFGFNTLVHSCFSCNEQLHINSAQAFYELWTRKEAILKATGEGLIDNMNELNCLSNQILRRETIYEVKTFSLEQPYIFSIATATKNQSTYFFNFY